jgi:hypothetical protein
MENNKDIADIRAAEAILHKKKKYLLCYHNFNVKNCKKSAEEIRKIAAVAGSPISIAVVPSIGGVPESEADVFREEIGKFVQEGYEILLHGVRHNADLFIKRNPIGKFALSISHNGAEFAGLNKKLSQMLLDRSIALWKAHGFGRPAGFIAPVWLDNKHLKKQVLEQFNFYEDMFYIYRKVGGRVKQAFSQILTFSIIPKPLLGSMQVFSRLALLLYRGTPRLVFHAGDMQAMGEENLLSLVKFASAKREKIMYGDL